MQTQCAIMPAGSGLPGVRTTADPFDILERIRAREALADAIHDAIAYLDAIDADPDLEETGDLEPSLGAYCGRDVDLELDDCDSEDGGDTELNGDELDFSDHTSGMDGGIGDMDGLAEQLSGVL